MVIQPDGSHDQNDHTNGHLTTSSKIDYNSIFLLETKPAAHATVCIWECIK